MSTGEIEVAGTLRPDGTVQLDQMPNLSPGRVAVVLRHERQTAKGQPLGDSFFRLMDEIWAGQKARGFIPASTDDVEARRKQLQAEMEEEIESAIRLQEECRQERAQVEEESRPP